MGNACTTENPQNPWCGSQEDTPQNDLTTLDSTLNNDSKDTPPKTSTNTSNDSAQIQRVPTNNNKNPLEAQKGSQSTPPRKNFRILLIGAGESGKTTFTQQLYLLYNMTQLNLEERKTSILQAFLENMKSVITSVYGHAKLLQIHPTSEVGVVEAILNANGIDKDFASNVKHLWGTDWIQRAFNERTKYWILDSAEWLVENIDRFADPSFVPTTADLLFCRRRTTGIAEHKYIVGDTMFTIIDVGGQRSERRKWVQLFADVHCIVFFVSAVGFSKVLFEDKNTSQMHESLELFSKTFRVPQPIPHAGKIDNDWTDYVFETTPIHLIFNKMDLLPAAIKDHAELFKAAFPQFTGDLNDFSHVVKHLEKAYSDRISAIRQAPDVNFISAMNDEHVERVFQTLSQFLIEKERAGHALNAFMAKELRNKKDERKPKLKPEDKNRAREKRIQELKMEN